MRNRTKHVGLAGLVFLVGAALAQDFSTLLVQGQSYLEQRRYEIAERLFRRAIEMRPQDPAAHYYLGVALLSQGEHEKAARSLEKAAYLSERPNPAVLFELGTAYLRMGRLEKAEETLRQAVELEPNRASFYLQLGWVHYKKVEGERARAEFEKAVELEATGISFYYLALAEHALGNIDGAAAASRRAIELEPDLADAHVVLGKCLARLGRLEEAQPRFEEALRLDPDAAEAYFQLGLIALRSGALEAALERFQESVRSDPTHQSGWYNLAIVYARLGREEEARAARARYEEVVGNAQRLKPKPKDKKDEPRF